MSDVDIINEKKHTACLCFSKKKGKVLSNEWIKLSSKINIFLLVQSQIMKKCQCKTALRNQSKIQWK